MTERDLGRIFKAYDVRGVVPDDLDEDLARTIGGAYATITDGRPILIGRDCRLSSPGLAAALAEGVTAQGSDVIDLGLASTDLLYFASGSLDLPGIMITASHNPKQYNGLKFCRSGARPVGEDTGLRDIRALVETGLTPSAHRGSVEQRNLLDAYVEHVLRFVDVDAMRPLVVVADTANGMGGLVAPAVFERLPITAHYLFPELDGTFPNHPADPLNPENQKDLKAAVLEHGADVGLAFDGDADRVFLVDEHAEDVSGSLLTAIVARRDAPRRAGRQDRAQLDLLVGRPRDDPRGGRRAGAHTRRPLLHQAGDGRHRRHLRRRALRPLLLPRELPGRLRADRRGRRAGGALGLGRLALGAARAYRRYWDSGEINSVVADQAGKIEELAARYADGRQDRLDGLTVEYEDWWCNVRPSNTEPLLRLNVEARSKELLDERTAALLAVIREEGGAA